MIGCVVVAVVDTKIVKSGDCALRALVSGYEDAGIHCPFRRPLSLGMVQSSCSVTSPHVMSVHF